MCGFNVRNTRITYNQFNTHNQIRIAICRGFYTGVFKNPFTPPGGLLFNPPLQGVWQLWFGVPGRRTLIALCLAGRIGLLDRI